MFVLCVSKWQLRIVDRKPNGCLQWFLYLARCLPEREWNHLPQGTFTNACEPVDDKCNIQQEQISARDEDSSLEGLGRAETYSARANKAKISISWKYKPWLKIIAQVRNLRREMKLKCTLQATKFQYTNVLTQHGLLNVFSCNILSHTCNRWLSQIIIKILL